MNALFVHVWRSVTRIVNLIIYHEKDEDYERIPSLYLNKTDLTLLFVPKFDRLDEINLKRYLRVSNWRIFTSLTV